VSAGIEIDFSKAGENGASGDTISVSVFLRTDHHAHEGRNHADRDLQDLSQSGLHVSQFINAQRIASRRGRMNEKMKAHCSSQSPRTLWPCTSFARTASCRRQNFHESYILESGGEDDRVRRCGHPQARDGNTGILFEGLKGRHRPVPDTRETLAEASQRPELKSSMRSAGAGGHGSHHVGFIGVQTIPTRWP